MSLTYSYTYASLSRLLYGLGGLLLGILALLSCWTLSNIMHEVKAHVFWKSYCFLMPVSLVMIVITWCLEHLLDLLCQVLAMVALRVLGKVHFSLFAVADWLWISIPLVTSLIRFPTQHPLVQIVKDVLLMHNKVKGTPKGKTLLRKTHSLLVLLSLKLDFESAIPLEEGKDQFLKQLYELRESVEIPLEGGSQLQQRISKIYDEDRGKQFVHWCGEIIDCLVAMMFLSKFEGDVDFLRNVFCHYRIFDTKNIRDLHLFFPNLKDVQLDQDETLLVWTKGARKYLGHATLRTKVFQAKLDALYATYTALRRFAASRSSTSIIPLSRGAIDSFFGFLLQLQSKQEAPREV